MYFICWFLFIKFQTWGVSSKSEEFFIAYCRNLPFGEKARWKWKAHLLVKKTCGVATNVYWRKTLEKPKGGLRILKRRAQELFTHGEGISTPHAYHKGWQPLIECAKNDFKIVYFPFFIFYFWGRKGCYPCSYVSSGAMRNSDLRGSLSLCVTLILCFLKDWF